MLDSNDLRKIFYIDDNIYFFDSSANKVVSCDGREDELNNSILCGEKELKEWIMDEILNEYKLG